MESDMAESPKPPVNPQITDAVTQANVKVLGDAPAMALANLYQASAQALSNAAHNATTAQQNANTVLQATTTQGVALLYGVDTASTSVGISEILSAFNNNS
jgi:hypothetical protein